MKVFFFVLLIIINIDLPRERFVVMEIQPVNIITYDLKYP